MIYFFQVIYMPSYVSHTIMAKSVYDKLNDKNVNKNYMIAFSLGGDLCKYSKCRKDSHRIKQDDFILNLLEFINDNNYQNDGDCLGVLYGHICHLIMDNDIHPLVRKTSSLCIKNKKNHTMIELYYDNYLSKKIFNQGLNKYDNKNLFNISFNKKINSMIDYAYSKTYGCNNISKYYKFNIWLYKKIKYIYKFCSFNFLKKVSGINNFLNMNKNINLTNSKHTTCYKLHGKDCTRDLLELYNISVDESIKYIKSLKIKK